MMKKISEALLLVVLLTGCSGKVQDKIDSYKEKRTKVVNTVEFLKAEADCIVQCNQDFSFGIKRADCKTGCIK